MRSIENIQRHRTAQWRHYVPLCANVHRYMFSRSRIQCALPHTMAKVDSDQWRIQRGHTRHAPRPPFSQSQPVYCSKVRNYITILDEMSSGKNPLCWTTTQLRAY